MRVRSARQADIAAIAQLSRELAAHVADPDPGLEVSELVELGFGADRWFDCLVAESEDEVVGFALYCRRFEVHTRSRKLWLGDLVVAKRHRGCGAGRMLLEKLLQTAVEMGCDGILLELWSENSAARVFYKNIGAKLDAGLEVHLIPTYIA